MEYDITMVRGDTLGFDIDVEGDIGQVDTVKMTARRATTDAVLFALTSGTGGDITATETGWAVRVPPAATLGAAPGAYKYDVEFIMDSDDVYTPLNGTLRIIEDQTREVS